MKQKMRNQGTEQKYLRLISVDIHLHPLRYTVFSGHSSASAMHLLAIRTNNFSLPSSLHSFRANTGFLNK